MKVENKEKNKPTLYYFGTDLRQAGHYFWELTGDNFGKSPIYFKDIPFDPYNGQKGRLKGGVVFWQVEGWSVCIIAGSCSDDRNGCVSTFFVKDTIALSELKEIILSNLIAKKIIDQMPFEVLWPVL